MKVALYARVSTTDKDQNPEVQLEVLREYCRQMDWQVYQEYVDYASAADLVRRKQWTALMKAVSARRFDVLLVWKIDRAFRSSIHAVGSLNILRAYNVGFRSYTQAEIDTTTPHGEFMFNILVAIAQLEREQIRQRVSAGMEYARVHGTKSGNPIGRKSFPVDVTIVCNALRDASGNRHQAARLIERWAGIKVSPAFVLQRIRRAGLTVEEVLAAEGVEEGE